MTKYYRVKQDTFIWEKGAILEYDSNLGNNGGYMPISDIWDVVENLNEYISGHIIESDNNNAWFERVYEVSVLGKAKYLAKDAAKKAHEELHKVGK